ncbi:hypothetical protein PVAP13_9KG154385 [Panicum virgatum]|uniref:Uncharacterized protein n=1 Tax=Panicum virgatum TaxID=38727 RepID=A0A8T0NN10_PANVG|nr:hypothetical protein PVAP13_9KG154385 [Panicum virgatum]
MFGIKQSMHTCVKSSINHQAKNLRAVILFACAQWDLNTTSCTEGEESLDFSTKYPMKYSHGESSNKLSYLAFWRRLPPYGLSTLIDLREGYHSY